MTWPLVLSASHPGTALNILPPPCACHIISFRLLLSTKVLSFYYRYLAAAEPLTDVVYGQEVRVALLGSNRFPRDTLLSLGRRIGIIFTWVV